MLQKSRELTQKAAVESDDSDHSEDHDDAEVETRLTTHNLNFKNANPWMTAAFKKTPVYTKPAAVVNEEAARDTREGGEDEEEEGSRERGARDRGDSHHDDIVEKGAHDENSDSEESPPSEDVNDVDLDQMFQGIESKKCSPSKNTTRTNRKKKKEKMSLDSPEESENDADERETGEGGEMLTQTLTRRQTLEDFEGPWNDADTEAAKTPSSHQTDSLKDTVVSKTTRKHVEDEEIRVDPAKFLTVESSVRGPLTPNIAADGEDQQRITIAQAFASDDVIEEFVQEKKDIEARDKPKDIDLSLPGWGAWGGTGLKTSKASKKK